MWSLVGVVQWVGVVFLNHVIGIRVDAGWSVRCGRVCCFRVHWVAWGSKRVRFGHVIAYPLVICDNGSLVRRVLVIGAWVAYSEWDVDAWCFRVWGQVLGLVIEEDVWLDCVEYPCLIVSRHHVCLVDVESMCFDGVECPFECLHSTGRDDGRLESGDVIPVLASLVGECVLYLVESPEQSCERAFLYGVVGVFGFVLCV